MNLGVDASLAATLPLFSAKANLSATIKAGFGYVDNKWKPTFTTELNTASPSFDLNGGWDDAEAYGILKVYIEPVVEVSFMNLGGVKFAARY